MAHHPSDSPRQDAASRLRALAVVATDLELPALSLEIQAFVRRVAGGLFYVAFLGQFKRGKSSLLNALVGGAQLPTGVVPVTSVVTIVRYSGVEHASIHFRSGDTHEVSIADLPAYVTEKGNPRNTKGVNVAEVFVRSDLLATGMCLVDTPGIGSISTENTGATKAFVPHIDAAVVVLGSDPPIAADELALVEDVAGQTTELIFVLNKADRGSETDRREARTFSEEVLAARLNRVVHPMLEVSAAERLSGSGPPRDWEPLVSRLVILAQSAGGHLLREAEDRGLKILGRRCVREIREREAALSRPLAESENRIAGLKESAEQAERSLSDLSYLLTAEQDRLHRLFVARQDGFRMRVVPSARVELEDSLRTVGVHSRSERWREAHRIAQVIFRRLVEAWRAEEQPSAETMYREATQRFIDMANEFLTRVMTDDRSSELPGVLASEHGFRTKSRLYFTDLMAITGRSPLRWLIDALRSPASFAAAVERHALNYLEHLIQTNATRVTNDLDEQVLESRRRLEYELRERLSDVYRVAERALERARAQRQRGAAAIREELERLAAARRVIEELLSSQSEIQ